jgi:diaminohydroxyphosphoribosylaminopyrimidine deaminase/5-amino-6-(5-phosphoribosylamino)uracil reductase
MATTMDGKIATKNFDSKWITNEKSRKFSHILRAENNAVLVGGNSFRKDNPQLNCRINGLKNSSPKAIIMSNNIDVKMQKQLQSRQIGTYIASSNKEYKKLENQYIKLILCKNNADGLIDIKDFLEKLPALGINNLLVEGGGSIVAEFLKAKIIDEIVLFQSGLIIGGDGVNAVAAAGVGLVVDIKQIGLNFSLKRIQKFDDDIMIIYSKED